MSADMVSTVFPDFNTTSAAPDNSTADYGSYERYTCRMATYYILNGLVYAIDLVVILALLLLPRPATKESIPSGLRNKVRFYFHRVCIYPLNMLDGYDHRFGYACIFGSMTVQLVDLLTKRSTLSGVISLGDLFGDGYTPAFTILLLTISVALVTLQFYPLFACITAEHKFAGAIMGLVGTVYRLCIKLWMMISCQFSVETRFVIERYEPLFYNLPSIVFLTILCGVFSATLVKCIRMGRFSFCPRVQVLAEEHHVMHVQRLLGSVPLPWHEEHLPHLSIFNMQKFKSVFVYRRLPYFKFPTRLVATFTIMASSLYQIGLLVIFTVYSTMKDLQKLVSTLDSFVIDILGPISLTPYLPAMVRYLGNAAQIWIVVTCFTFVMAVVYLYHTSLCYRKHIFRLYRGDRRIFPSSFLRQDNPNVMTNAVRYAGLQIAFFMWGFVLIQLAVFVIVAVIVFVLFVPMVEYQYFNIVRYLAEFIMVPIVINILIYYIQVITTRFTFLQPKTNATDPKVPLAVNNRHAFYNVSLFFFFWNIFLGIVSAIMRVLKGMLLGVFLIPRIDRSVMMRGYESMDAGFMCYLGMLTVIGAHDHPVAKVFLKILREGADTHKVAVRDSLEMKQRRSSQKARHNWFLAYTLLNNPELITHRKTYVKLDDVEDTARHVVMVAVRKKREGGRTADLFAHAAAAPLVSVNSTSTEQLNKA